MQDVQETVPVLTDSDMTAVSTNPVDITAAETELPAAEETASEVCGDTALQMSDEMYWPVYNGKTHPIRATDREEVTTLLQLGMKQREFLPHYERLSRLAQAKGAVSVKALIDELCDADEAARKQEAIDTYGENGERFYEMEREHRERQFRSSQASEDVHVADEVERLADEFLKLQAAYPTFADVRDVPIAVLKLSAEEGISLLDAQNRIVLSDERRRKAEEQAALEAARNSAGPLSGDRDETKPSAMEAFLSGLNSRF